MLPKSRLNYLLTYFRNGLKFASNVASCRHAAFAASLASAPATAISSSDVAGSPHPTNSARCLALDYSPSLRVCAYGAMALSPSADSSDAAAAAWAMWLWSAASQMIGRERP